jgi:excisionase family DNA binding protein
VIEISLLPPLLTVKETSTLLRLSTRTIRRRVARGELATVDVGRGQLRIVRNPLLEALGLAGAGPRRRPAADDAEYERACAALGIGREENEP